MFINQFSDVESETWITNPVYFTSFKIFKGMHKGFIYTFYLQEESARKLENRKIYENPNTDFRF